MDNLGKSILRKDNLLEDRNEDGEENLAFYEVEVQLRTLQSEVDKLTELIDQAEIDIRVRCLRK